MWTDLTFNLVLLMMSDYLFILAASNVGYIIFNFLNLNAGWIHRMDRPGWERPYRAPTILIAIGGVLAYVNAALMGAGADVWGAHTLWTGLIFAALIIPVFLFRHYIQDKGVFPKDMMEDMHLGKEEGVEEPGGHPSLRGPRCRRGDRVGDALLGLELGETTSARNSGHGMHPHRGRSFFFGASGPEYGQAPRAIAKHRLGRARMSSGRHPRHTVSPTLRPELLDSL